MFLSDEPRGSRVRRVCNLCCLINRPACRRFPDHPGLWRALAVFAAGCDTGRPSNVDHSVTRARVDSDRLREHSFVKREDHI